MDSSLHRLLHDRCEEHDHKERDDDDENELSIRECFPFHHLEIITGPSMKRPRR